MKDFKDTMNKVVGSILDSVHEDGTAMEDNLDPFKTEHVLTRAIADKNPEEYFYGLEYEIEKTLDAFVTNHIGGNDQLHFLFRNYNFVERSFNKLIKQHEGWTCSADKSRTIVRRLVEFYSSGKEITFNYEGEYTYHLPKKVFTEHEQIVDFFEALRRLYYGNPQNYFEFFAKYKSIFLDKQEEVNAD